MDAYCWAQQTPRTFCLRLFGQGYANFSSKVGVERRGDATCCWKAGRAGRLDKGGTAGPVGAIRYLYGRYPFARDSYRLPVALSRQEGDLQRRAPVSDLSA
jgi:hypothetical protein